MHDALHRRRRCCRRRKLSRVACLRVTRVRPSGPENEQALLCAHLRKGLRLPAGRKLPQLGLHRPGLRAIWLDHGATAHGHGVATGGIARGENRRRQDYERRLWAGAPVPERVQPVVLVHGEMFLRQPASVVRYARATYLAASCLTSARAQKKRSFPPTISPTARPSALCCTCSNLLSRTSASSGLRW